MLKYKSIKKMILEWSDKNTDIKILPVALVSIVLVMALLTSGRFLSSYNINSMAYQLPELGLLSLAMMIAMLTGGINLSIISSANFVGVIMALLMTNFLDPTATGISVGLSIFLIIIIGLLFSILLGFVNGILIAYVEISPVLATLGTMILFEGLTLSITKGYVISDFPQAMLSIGNGKLFGIPTPFIIFAVIAFLVSIVIKRKPLGRYLFMIGSNSIASEYSCINVKQAIVRSYILSGMLSGMAGVIMISRFNSANARYGVSYMLLSVLISVLGGTDPDGGSGKVLGIVLALFTLQSLSSGFNLLEISSFVTVALWGILLALVIAYRHYAVNKRNTLLSKLSERTE